VTRSSVAGCSLMNLMPSASPGPASPGIPLQWACPPCPLVSTHSSLLARPWLRAWQGLPLLEAWTLAHQGLTV